LDLIKVKAPKALIAIVLCLIWNTELSFDSDYQFLEVFAGKGRVSQRMHSLGYHVASVDFDYSRKHMDFLQVAGFLLVLQTVLNLGPRALSLWAPDCGSWGIPCRGTSMRSEINPCGFEMYEFVSKANLMVSRMTLALILVVSRTCFFLVEQPSQSLLHKHPRIDWFFNRVVWAFNVRFWMMHHGGGSSKRSVFWGNVSTMGMLDKGTLSRAEREKKTTIKTSRKYVDKSGVARFVGDKKELKRSQAYPRGLADSIHKLYVEELKSPVHGDLRVIPKYEILASKNGDKTELQLFMELPMADCWTDAKLLPVFEYIYFCKHTRIPAEWKAAMEAFYKDFVDAHK